MNQTRFPCLTYLLTGVFPGGVAPDVAAEIAKARKAHKPVAPLLREQRDRVHAALRGRG
jgi:hypothetical protein